MKLPENNELNQMNTSSPMLNLDPVRLNELASSIMKSNKPEQVAAYEELLHSYESLTQVLTFLCRSKEIYFVTSELILRMLKKNVNQMKLKLSNSLVMMMNQSFNLQQFKSRTTKIYNLIQDTYIQLLVSNIESLQKYEYNQALQIITLSLSQLFNITAEEEQPHIKLISSLYVNYYQNNPQNNILGFILNYEPFESIRQIQIVTPSNIHLYKALLSIMTQVIEIKENWEDPKYTQSQILSNHRIFKNKFLSQWTQFTIKQAKIVFSLFLEQNTSFFPLLVLPEIVKLLHKVLTFSYESPNLRTYEWVKDKFVKYPQYTFPQGILKSVGNDYTFLQTLHRVHMKICKNFLTRKAQTNNVITSQQNYSLQYNLKDSLNQQKTALQICELILSIYGRVFFLTVDQNIMIKPINFPKEVPLFLHLNYVKVQILSQIIQNPELYFCRFQNANGRFQQHYGKQRYTLYFGIVQILTQIVTYGVFGHDNKSKGDFSLENDSFYTTMKLKIKQFLVNIMRFADGFCLKKQCWNVLYGKDQAVQSSQIFTQSRHYEITFTARVFQLLFQCHNQLEAKFLDTINESSQIIEFYQNYFKITDEFLQMFENQFTTKIYKLNQNDLSLEYNFLKEIINSLPYSKIKDDQVIETKWNESLNGQHQQWKQEQNQDQNCCLTTLKYFDKFDQLILSLTQSLQQKFITLNSNQQSISFLFYLAAILIQNYLNNPNFYYRSSVPLVGLIKDLLKVTFQYSQQIKAPSMFAFYEQIVSILSQKSLNSKQLLDIIFRVQEQALGIRSNLHKNILIDSTLPYFQLNDKNTTQRSFELVKKLMERTCQSLVTKDVKEFDAALIVLNKIFNLFHKNSFATEFSYLKEFFENYMNLQNSLLSLPTNRTQKLQFIEITVKFLQIKANDFSLIQKSKIINSFNNALFQPFKQKKSIEALTDYFQSIQIIIQTQELNKIYVIDVFLGTIKDYVNEINKNYRKLIKQNINFFQASKSLLLTILEVVQIFGGPKWGSKHVEQENNQNQENDERLYHSMYDKDQNDLFKQVQSVNWEQNQKDTELPLIIEEYFYTWVKQLGRDEYETENGGQWTKQKRDLHNRTLISIYAQYLHLTPNGKLPPLPKSLVQQERNMKEVQKLENNGQQCPQLDDFLPNETKTTKLIIRLYLQNLYRVSNSSLMAVYPSIDYKLEYVIKWWDEIMVRSLRPEINVSYVYEKFVIFGQNCQVSQNNRVLAELFYKIANYYRQDMEFMEKYVCQPYIIKMINYGQEEFPLQKSNQNNVFHMKSEDRKSYINRILMYWTYTLVHSR